MVIIIIIVLATSIFSYLYLSEDTLFEANEPGGCLEGLEFLPIAIIGFPGSILGVIVRKRREKAKHNKYVQEKLDERNTYISTYGDTPENLKRRIQSSPHIELIANHLCKMTPLPRTIWVANDRLVCFFHDETKLNPISIYYSKWGLEPIPLDCRQTLAVALSSSNELKNIYQYRYNGGEWSTYDQEHILVLMVDHQIKSW